MIVSVDELDHATALELLHRQDVLQAEARQVIADMIEDAERSGITDSHAIA